MSRPAKWSVVVLAMLMLQVLAVLSQTYVIENSKSASNADSSEFDYYFEHTHPLESLISIESTPGERGSYEISVTSELQAEVSLEVISPDILDLPFGRSTQFSLEPGGEYSFSLTKYPINGDVDITIVANAVTTEGYRFREQHTILSEPASDEECPDYLTPAEAMARGCTEAEAPASSLLESYSFGVQSAFLLVSDMSRYNEEQLSGTADWLVVTEMSLEAHAYSSAGPDHSEPALLLKGSYIWSFDDPSLALDSLERAVKTGEIEIFYPLVEIQAQPEFTPNDTLFPDQWHLVNTAQHGGTAVAGEDVNITGVWDDYNGTGVVISIIDNGVETDHPDLSTNWNSAVSYDWCGSDSDPSPQSADDNHGTPVAGIAAATGNNNLDVTGAAFGATLSAQKIPLGTSVCAAWSDYTQGLALSYYNDAIDIYQNSWGPIEYYYNSVFAYTTAAFENDVQNGRGGLGNIIVFSAGNGLKEGANSNYGDKANSRYTIAVSAITDSGEQTFYSEPGTNILVAAYAGEQYQAGITTTDRTGSDGESAGDTWDSMGGTSAAAPLVSGIIALMLEANEDLTWRDVQHILVNSARKNDATDSSWVVNGAGHDVSEKYGFGAIDAGAAVEKALAWSTVGTEVTSSYGPFLPASAIADPTSLCQMYTTSSSTDSDSDGYKDEECTFTLPAGETLELVLRLPDAYASEVGVKLTDPSGTQTVWAHGTFPNLHSSNAISREQSFDNSLLYGNLTQLDTYATAGTYTLQIYDYWGDGCGGYATNYPISCAVFASYGSDWTESTTTVSGGLNSIESIELTVDITHTNRSDLDIVLVSPSGTESWLARNYHDGNSVDHIDWTFSSVHHWDESSDGTWTLKVRDMAAGDSGTMNSWTLNTYGTNNQLYVTGAFEYEDREFDEGGFTGVNPYLPIRGADVEIFDDSTGAILATTRTNNLGVFNASITIGSATDIGVRVLTSSEEHQRLFNQTVRKTPATGSAIYSLTSSIFSNNQPGVNIDFTSSPVRAGASGVAGAFNVFDMAEFAESYVENLTSQPAPLNLTLYWTAGEGSTGSKWYDLNGNVYLCGTSDDDDSYDDVVILHEIGHYIHLSYSGSPAYYGGHSLAGIYDLRLGFTEGVGTYFAGAIRNYMGVDQPLIYIETTGTSLRFYGFSMASNTDTIAGYSSSTFSALDAGNEATVGHVIFEVVDGASTNDGSMGTDDDSIDLPNMQGDQMVFDVFVAIKDNESTLSVVNGKRISLETFYDYWVILHPSYASAFQQILLDHGVEYQEDAMEPDNSTSAATWIETDGSSYHHTYFPAGDVDWSKFNGSAGAEWLIKTRNLANGADTILQVYDTDGTTLLATNDDATSSTVASAIQFTASADATYYIKTYRYEDTIPIGRYGDFDLTISDINHPSISSLSPSSGSVNGGYTVDITGDNFESELTVNFGVYAASGVTLNSATSLTVTVPANIPGYSDITITNPVTSDGITPQGSLSDGFEYTGSPLDPSISSISPDFGDYSDSTEVTITGDYLIDGLTTALGSNTLSSLTVVDAKTIQATVQSVPRGVHTVTVTNPNGASSSIVNAFESTLTEIATVGSTFVSGSPLQNTITISEDVRMSDLYVHVNVSHPIVPAKLDLTLETPDGQMIALFDEIQVADETFSWKSGFDSIFGYDEAPSEALYQLKGKSTLGDWILHASSSSSSTNTLHSWGVSFLEYRHRGHGDQVYCAAEYRNHVMSLDGDSGDLLFRAQYQGSYDYDTAISDDGRYLFSAGAAYHDGVSWDNSIINVYDAWTGQSVNTYQLTGRASPGSLAPVSNGDLVVATSTQLYLIDIANQAITGNISLIFNDIWETYAVAVNPAGTVVFVTNKDESLLQTYSLPSLIHLGNMTTGTYSPFDVDISSDGSFGIIGYDEELIVEFYTSNLSIYASHSVATLRAGIELNYDDSEVYAGLFQSNAGFSHLDLVTGTSTQYSDGYGSTHGVYRLDDRVYLSEWGGNRIIVWDPVAMEGVSTIDLTPFDGYRCRGIAAAAPPGMLSPGISATSTDLVLSWSTPSTGPTVTEYRVYKGDSPGNESFHATVAHGVQIYTDTSASSTALSYYRVSAVMAGIGEGPVSSRLIGAPGSDFDGDGIADALDDDDDGDGVPDTDDAFPLDSSEDTDTDGDGIGNNADTDDDGDGVADSSDAFPLDSSEDTDTDGDGIGNNADTDDDGDGVADSSDAFPLDSSEDTDTDGDGIGNNADTDDDGDGWTDADELTCSTDPVDATSIPADADSDGICDEVDTDRTVSGFQAGSVFTDATLSARGDSSCIILDNASLYCWGSNSGSKLGTGSSRSNPTVADLGTGRTAVATAVGYYNSCAILDDGSVKCWGQGNGGSSGSTVSIGSGRIAVAITAGFDHACAILDNASLICWGGNGYGQLGDGTTTSASTSSPASVDFGTGRTVVAVAAGHGHTCAILDNASLYCWGDNAEGKLGDGTATTSSTPVSVDVGAGRSAVAISAGNYHTCAILDDASLKCWGINNYGNLGDGTTESTCDAGPSSCTPPVSVDLGTGRTAVAISLGNIHSCAVLDDASLKCWGYGRNGELGRGSYSDSHTPVAVSLPSPRTAVAVAAGQYHTCAILDNLSVQCWGANNYGQVGDGTAGANAERTTPVYVNLSSGSLAAVSERDLDTDDTLNIFDTHMKGSEAGLVYTNSAISAGLRHTCAILDDATLKCWGWNGYGQIGDGTTTDRSTPVEVSLPSGQNALSITTGRRHTCAILDDASLYCWGDNDHGQLGDGTTTDSSSPVAVSLPSGRTAMALASGFYHTCAILDDASLHCWGDNGYGQLGDGTNTARTTPTAVNLPSGRTAITVSIGRYHTCSVLDNASLYCWGYNGYGNLGDGTTTDRSTPVSVSLPSGSTAALVTAGTGLSHTCAVLNDGSLYCWGHNDYGQLGDGSTTTSYTPVAVSLPSGRSATSVGAGNYHTCGILDDASLYCWGYNGEGEVGDGTNYDKSTPTQAALPSGRTALALDVGSHHACAVLDDESMVCWGSGDDGQLGTGNEGANADEWSPTAVSLPSGRTVGRDMDWDGDGTIDLLDDHSGNPARSISCTTGSYGRYVCIDATAGHYASAGGMFQTECSAGTYQASSGQGSCDDADAGHYVESAAATSQTACLAGTYNPNTASSSSSDCIDASAGNYTSSAGSASQTACAAGTYQASTGQTSCDVADAGYYVSTTGAHSQTACAAGTYQASTGQTSCTDADAGYYVSTTAATSQAACSAGAYQALTGQSSCDDADAGYYVPSSAATSQTACGTGSFQPSTGQTSCLDADAGYYVSSTGSASQYACATGTYQPDTGQSSCTDASAGYYVSTTAATSQTACAAGTYQPSTGQSSCTDASAGYYVSATAATSQTACAAGTYQASTGQTSCDDADAGYYVSTTAATSQTACSAGTYQPSTGQSSCTDASAGYYVSTTAATSQTACAAGTYQASTGQTSCDDADAGYYVSTTAATSQTACSAGTYQPSTGQSSCTDASAGYYVASAGSASQTACAAGTYQPSIAQTSCIDASAGYYVSTTAATSQTACAAGTYQPSTGQTSCDDADAGYYVSTTAATSQTACSAGTYQPSTGQSSCTDASAGYYVSTTAATSQTACSAGTYQASTGQTSCDDADAGYYVSTTAATSQTACAAGTYQPSSAQTSCIDADAGYYVSTTAATSQTACAAGTYQPSTAQTSCIDASAGYYVDTTAATSQTACPAGTYNPNTGSTDSSACIEAAEGYYVPNAGSASQTACSLGTYQSDEGQTSCDEADAGYYVDTMAATDQTACDPGTYQPDTGQASCIDASAGYYVDTMAATSQTACDPGTYQPDVGQTSCEDADMGYYVSTSAAIEQTPASPGYYVNTTAATSQTACAAGTYQPLSAQTACIDASAGYYVDTTAAISQTACDPGTYQPNSGSSSCYQASAGYYVNSIASTSQTACSPGAYQPNQGQTSCLDADVGYYVNTTAATAQTACGPGAYQPSTGQTSCIEASPGYYVDSYASASQTACSPGTYQPNNASSSCHDASPGYYVPTTGAINQTACSPGTYNPNSGSYSSTDCVLASGGYYVASAGMAEQTPCSSGTYQPSTGQTNCIHSTPGYYVSSNASTVQTPCAIGHYQPNNASSSCYEAEPGHYVNFQSATDQTACDAGTYNPSNGSISSDDCIDASPGNFAPVSGMPYQIGCHPGTYTPLSGQTSCIPADAGHYVGSNGSTAQTECALGTYQPSTGRDSCEQAEPGYYVDYTAATSQTACLAGTYNPENASTSQDSCLQADPGHYTSNNSMPYQIPCPVGTYQSSEGQTGCIGASPGHYVLVEGSHIQTACTPGTYNPEHGSSNSSACIDAGPGYFTPEHGSIQTTACSLGTYQPSSGQASCIEADPGHFVGSEASTVQTAAPTDYYASGYASTNPEACPESFMTFDTGSESFEDCHLDSDSDRIPDYEDEDDDNDGQPDQDDFCSPGVQGWMSGLVEDRDDDGCRDSDEDIDDDNDGRLDVNDVFPFDPSEQDDNDGDGEGDNADLDDDNDGLSDIWEYNIGTDSMDSDTDDDGYSDKDDAFPNDPSEWLDSDGDGVGDNSDIIKSMARYQTQVDVMIDLVVAAIAILAATSYSKSRIRYYDDEEE